jgi:hypothetical protein
VRLSGLTGRSHHHLVGTGTPLMALLFVLRGIFDVSESGFAIPWTAQISTWT